MNMLNELETIRDPLYGAIRHSHDERMQWDLYRTHVLARLRDISLSSVPSRMTQEAHAPSRFEHSVGVAYLARELAKKNSFAPFKQELIAAALLHDSASVPFSHTAEIFQLDATGKTHEEGVIDVLEHTEIKAIFKKYGLDAERVHSLILGNHPELGSVLAGSIDLDNLDNSARLLRAVGAVNEPPYSPKKLIKAFQLQRGNLVLDSSYIKDILGWQECRRQLYSEVLYGKRKLAAACMLYRAIEFAYNMGKLNENFYAMGESQAIMYLLSMPEPISNLIDDALAWRFYHPVWHWTVHGQDGKINRLSNDWHEKKAFADRIAKILKLPLDHVVVHAGRDKGVKGIHLEFFGERTEACEALFRSPKELQQIGVYLHPTHKLAQNRVNEACEHSLSQVPLGDEIYRLS